MPSKPTTNKSGTRIKIEGFNQIRLINAVAEAGVKIGNIDRVSGREMTLTVANKDAQKTFAICGKLCYNYAVTEIRGGRAAVFNALMRFGILLGLIVGAFLTAFFSGFVMKIEINELKSLSGKQILSVLADNNINVMSRLSEVDSEDVRQTVLSVDGVAECSVEIRGNRVIISIIEKSDKYSGLEVYDNLFSGYDAEVTSVSALKGTPKVSIGQRIKKGDLLIEGVVYNSQGEVIEKSGASGIVYGKVVKSVNAYVPLDAEVLKETGRITRVTAIDFFGIKLFGSESPYEYYSAKSGTAKFDAFLPIGFTGTEYRELKYEKAYESIDDAAEKIKNEALSEFIADKPTDIKTTVYKSQIAGNIYKVTVYIESVVIISKA